MSGMSKKVSVKTIMPKESFISDVSVLVMVVVDGEQCDGGSVVGWWWRQWRWWFDVGVGR